MVDYDFYVNTYLGSAIGEKAFAAAAARAEGELERFKRSFRVEIPGQDSEKMALCAMAEVLHAGEKCRNLRSASVGGVSVSYADDNALAGQLYRAAAVYLTFYRGVGV